MAEDKNLDSELEQEISQKPAGEEVSSADSLSVENVEIPNEVSDVTDASDTFEEDDNNTQDMITVRPIKFQKFELTEPNRSIKRNLDIMQDVSMHVSVELGKSKSSIREVIDMEPGSIVELDKIAGEQVEVYVNNKLVAKGEVIVIEDKFGVRVTSTSLPKTLA